MKSYFRRSMVEEVDEGFNIEGNCYTIKLDKDRYILKRYYVEKAKKLLYAFIGGMWYSKNVFSLEQDISLPYPFSTYYTFKILDKKCDDELCRSLLYVKMPLIVLQFEDKCVAIEFDPLIKINGKEIFPFISLSENKEHYIITFYLFKEFEIKEKESAWLGIGKKKRIEVEIKPGDDFHFSVKIKEYKKWQDAVRKSAERAENVDIKDAKEVFEKGKQALWRSYDHLTGTFLQLPWRNATGFTFVNSSYSLLTYDAVRLYCFTKWYEESGDKDFREWSEKLRNLFTNPKLYKRDLKRGKGIVWYNMTNLTKNGLQGYFYMDCGYGGYPGGQATIAFHLLQYLNYRDDAEIEHLVKQSLGYIMSTQKKNGSWPMAIKQEGLIKMRPERLDRYETFVGTSECIRALIAGYKRFKDEEMKTSAFKGLDYLRDNYPICYNGLRDIGINEAEAFSAVSIIDAFLDAYDLTGDKELLENALNYAYYALTWFYFYDTDNLRLKYNFHPISFSITPRLSPYESMWIVSTYMRLYNVTKDNLWKRMAKLTYNEAVKWRSENGGLSEGVFPRGFDELKPLPMEQTFATVEMLRASTNFFQLDQRKPKEKSKVNRKTVIKRDKEKLIFLYDGKEVMIFDLNKFKVTSIYGAKLNIYGISFSFFDSYSLKSKIKMRIKQRLRGKYGKFLLGLGDAKYFLQGVKKPEQYSKVKVNSFELYRKKKLHTYISGNMAKVSCETELHKIIFEIYINEEREQIIISFDPLIIEVLKHDISCKQVLFPTVGSASIRKTGTSLQFDGFEVRGDFKKVVETPDFTAVDQTLATNWTHGGVYKGKFEIMIKIS